MLKKLLILLVPPLLLLQGCIKEEPLELEADITKVHDLHESFLMNPIVTNNRVVVYVKPKKVDLASYNLKFELTKGASVLPDPSIKQDFTKEVEYVITSENQEYVKTYVVQVIELENAIPGDFGFEHFAVLPEDTPEKNGGNFLSFFDVVEGEKFYNWTSGNPGYAIVAGALLNGEKPTPDVYPTKITKNAYKGESALLLETMETGELGAIVNSPMAAGNLYIGSFDILSALSGAKKATRFGLPFNRVPVSLEGYFKYKAASPVLTPNPDQSAKDKLIETSLIDSCNIYAVLYNRKEVEARGQKAGFPSVTVDWLDGDNIMTDPSILAIAELDDGSTTLGDEFVHFNIPFKFLKEFNANDVYALDYNLAIVMTSSKRGDQFTGALGSKLIVDELKINTK